MVLKVIDGIATYVDDDNKDIPYQEDTRSYEQKVEDYISERYTVKQELALINNYNLDNEKYKQEYEEYQAYRASCKLRAKGL